MPNLTNHVIFVLISFKKNIENKFLESNQNKQVRPCEKKPNLKNTQFFFFKFGFFFSEKEIPNPYKLYDFF